MVGSKNHTIPRRHTGSSISAHMSDARELGKLKNYADVVGLNGQLTKETKVVEGEEVTQLVRMPARTPSPSSASWSLTTASRFSPMTPYTPNSTANSYLGPSKLLPCSILHPRSFTNATSQPLACLFSKRRRSRLSLPLAPFHSPSATQSRLLEAQPQCFGSSPGHSPTITLFQQQPSNFYSIYSPSDSL